MKQSVTSYATAIIGRPEQKDDPRIKANADRVKNNVALIAIHCRRASEDVRDAKVRAPVRADNRPANRGGLGDPAKGGQEVLRPGRRSSVHPRTQRSADP